MSFVKPHRQIPLTETDVRRFWSHVHIVADADSCWEWKRRITPAGYGIIVLGTGDSRENFYAHRVAYKIQAEDDPQDKVVCHKCDNRRCVRGSHLWTGTYQENIQDAGRKRRMGVQVKPESYSHVKLNYEIAAQIRACTGTHAEVAK
jgi:hypothetical protein